MTQLHSVKLFVPDLAKRSYPMRTKPSAYGESGELVNLPQKTGAGGAARARVRDLEDWLCLR